MESTRRKVLAGAGGFGTLGVLGGGLGYQRLVADGGFDPPEKFDEKTGFRVGILGDPHWRDDDRGMIKGVGSSAIVKKEELKRNIDTFAADMQSQFKSDMVVQIGDLADGFGGWETQREWLTEAKDYLETESAGSGVENVHHLAGNHEYKLVPVDDRQDMYDVFGWDGIGDTFRHVEIGDVNLLLLNTAYSETHSSEGTRDHKVPEEQFEWLEQRIPEIEGPVITFSHIGLTEATGTEYDTSEGKEVLLEMLHQLDYRLGVFGHSHHTDGWDQVRSQTDGYGTQHIHVPTPNLYKTESGITRFDDVRHVDYKTVPYLKLEIYEDGSWVAHPSYGNTVYESAPS